MCQGGGTLPVVCVVLSDLVELIKLCIHLNVRMSFPWEGEYVATAFATNSNGY